MDDQLNRRMTDHFNVIECFFVHAQIPGTIGVVGSSNIKEHSLSFDLSVFKSVLQIEVRDMYYFCQVIICCY